MCTICIASSTVSETESRAESNGSQVVALLHSTTTILFGNSHYSVIASIEVSARLGRCVWYLGVPVVVATPNVSFSTIRYCRDHQPHTAQ